jgi:hypothetical protein
MKIDGITLFLIGILAIEIVLAARKFLREHGISLMPRITAPEGVSAGLARIKESVEIVALDLYQPFKDLADFMSGKQYESSPSLLGYETYRHGLDERPRQLTASVLPKTCVRCASPDLALISEQRYSNGETYKVMKCGYCNLSKWYLQK